MHLTARDVIRQQNEAAMRARVIEAMFIWPLYEALAKLIAEQMASRDEQQGDRK